MGMGGMQNMQNMQHRYPGEREREGERERDVTKERESENESESERERDRTRERAGVRGGDIGGYRGHNHWHGQQVQGPAKRNVEINKQITVCKDS
jgi:hypothetical protein